MEFQGFTFPYFPRIWRILGDANVPFMVLMDSITSPQLIQHKDIMKQWVHYLLYQRSTMVYENVVVNCSQFHRLVSWFAPAVKITLDKEEEIQTFLHGIGENLYRIYSAPWFIGHYEGDKVRSLLNSEEQMAKEFFLFDQV
eukprot:TRINITY_DN2038_c0_g1_i14.p3 TRINITY_DN2038_c0_g1~~TRINITY_DN2038_c0_g1_i14.p3  ORF type:complete len:141 (+),score=27.40 TRINITY_DN2038_c0_g1_i14:1362-1784(+)